MTLTTLSDSTPAHIALSSARESHPPFHPPTTTSHCSLFVILVSLLHHILPCIGIGESDYYLHLSYTIHAIVYFQVLETALGQCWQMSGTLAAICEHAASVPRPVQNATSCEAACAERVSVLPHCLCACSSIYCTQDRIGAKFITFM